MSIAKSQPVYLKRQALCCLVVIMLMLTLAPVVNAQNGHVVLVAAKGSGIDAVSLRDVRRVYMGLKSSESKAIKKPVINMESEELYDDFLKNVMHMTEGSYNRKLVKRIFRQGTEEIKRIYSYEELSAYLNNHVGDITFIDIDNIGELDNVEVVQVLW